LNEQQLRDLESSFVLGSLGFVVSKGSIHAGIDAVAN